MNQSSITQNPPNCFNDPSRYAFLLVRDFLANIDKRDRSSLRVRINIGVLLRESLDNFREKWGIE